MVCHARVKGGQRKTSFRKKFGIQIPESEAEAYALDKKNGNTYWQDSIKSEVDSVMGKGTLAFPKTQAEQDNLREQIRTDPKFQFAPMWMDLMLNPSALRQRHAIAAATYGAELQASRMASEEALGIRYLLRSLGVKLDGPTHLFGDNESSLKSSTIPKSPLNQRHLGISYHFTRESEASGATVRYFVKSKLNKADGLTKALGKMDHQAVYGTGGPVFGKTPGGR